MDEKTPIFGGGGGGEEQTPIYRDFIREKNTKIFLGIFLVVVAVFIGITVIVTGIQSHAVTPLYILLLINLLAFTQVLGFLVYFIYTEKLSKKWFMSIFVIGIFVIIESINTDILMFTIEHTS